MKKEEFDSKMTSMLDKIGTDSSNLILDDVAILLSDNENMNKEIENRDKQIADLKKRNETLQSVNGNLLKQVGMNQDSEESRIRNQDRLDVDKGKPEFNMKSVFDKNRTL